MWTPCLVLGMSEIVIVDFLLCWLVRLREPNSLLHNSKILDINLILWLDVARGQQRFVHKKVCIVKVVPTFSSRKGLKWVWT